MLDFTTPVLYRDFEVGRIERIELDEARDKVNLYAVVYEKYAPLVQDTTRFWNVSGVDVTAALSGIKVESRPLVALFYGGNHLQFKAHGVISLSTSLPLAVYVVHK